MYIKAFAVALGVAALAACNQSPQEQQAENIEANADNAADAFEEAADNATNEVEADTLENQADALREGGDNIAEEVRDNGDANTAQ